MDTISFDGLGTIQTKEYSMNILWGFAPFILFVVIERLVGLTAGLTSAAILSAILVARDWRLPDKKVKVLEIGTVILFCGLAIYATATGAAWSIVGVRLRVDVGLLLIVLVSIAIRRPFTLQYARERVPRELWNEPRFIHINYVITWVWAAAFAVLVIADLILLYVTNLSPRIGIFATILALYGAFQFTTWYPERESKSQQPSA